MPQIKETILAPPLDGGVWLQGGPIDFSGPHRGRVILVDFWDYTCVNCLRTLPYVAAWHQRYEQAGLIVVGVHAPEFTFAREDSNVARAVRDLKLEYPIVIDNDYAIWRRYSNRCWPAKYLIDAEGRLRYYHFGEGQYGEIETRIQELLREINPSLELPPVVEPIRDTDRPGALCYRVTPELYLGYARGQFGNPEGPARDRIFDYRDVGHYAEGLAYLAGRWQVGTESSVAAASGASLNLRYTAMDVNLVMAPPAAGAARVEIVLDASHVVGEDASVENGRNFVFVDRARMYRLIANQSVQSGSLRLIAHDPGLAVFAFTFISCAIS
jgi:thiol-disulfide isomerase/thioredoxin